MPTKAARHTQTAPVSVFGCLLSSVVPWTCLGGIWRMPGGCPGDIWVVFIEIGGARMCLVGIWVLTGFLALAVCSCNTIFTQPGKAWLFSPDHSETSKYQNVYIWGWQKWLGYMISLFFNARQKDIKNGSCKWSPCSWHKFDLHYFVSMIIMFYEYDLCIILRIIWVRSAWRKVRVLTILA